jgi:hypothetical protein
MAKDKLTEYSATNASNDVIGDISVAEGMLPSAVNNALREQMTHLKNFSDGTDAIDALAVDNLKLDGNTISSTDTNGDITLDPNGTGDVVVSSGNVGIGTASPNKVLHLETSGETVQRMVASTTNLAGFYFGDSGNGSIGQLIYDNSSDAMRFTTNASERMRIDSSGNLLVGNSTFGAEDGVYISQGGNYVWARSDDTSGYFDRTGSDGKILELRKDGTIVGNIQTKAGFLSIGTGVTGLMFAGGEDAIEPHNITTQSGRDNAIDLGAASVRFDDIRATNGTIQTSDQNDKQQISSLTNAEITAAKSISTLFKTFKWNDKVEAKGDAARTHAGVIAQDVQAAMTAAGLDATKYAFWCSDTWWEHSVDVAAVEAVDEVLDDDGNVVTEAVEAVAAYTRTDTYQTAEEAPEGATQRTRLGIRYPELLAFVGAATEQRLADIETRLAALEA